MRVKRFILAGLAALAFAGSAQAADPKGIYGLWVEMLPTGGGMVTEFTPTTISAWGVDADGKTISTPNTAAVSYRDLGPAIGVDFQQGGGLLVQVKGPTDIILSFPDADSHELKPWKPPVATPKGPKS